jgi:hypothetical protein
MPLTLLYMVIARSLSDVTISQRDSSASLGMTNARLFMGQDTRLQIEAIERHGIETFGI